MSMLVPTLICVSPLVQDLRWLENWHSGLLATGLLINTSGCFTLPS